MNTRTSTAAATEESPALDRGLGILDIPFVPGPSARVEHQTARVLSTTPLLTVQLAGQSMPARRATSCLVRPEAGDTAIVARTDEGLFVLSILSRDSSTTTLVADGDLAVHVTNGRFSVASKDGIDLATPARVGIAAGELALHARAARLAAEEIVVLGAKAIVEVVDTRLKGTLLDGVFERVSQRVKRSFRTVEETDTVRAKDIDYKAESTVNLRSQNMVMTSKELIKADAEQIHFG